MRRPTSPCPTERSSSSCRPIPLSCNPPSTSGPCSTSRLQTATSRPSTISTQLSPTAAAPSPPCPMSFARALTSTGGQPCPLGLNHPELVSDDEQRHLAAYTVDDHLARELVQDVVQAFAEGRHSLRKLQMMVSYHRR